MKGLFVKDLLIMKKQWKFFGLLALIGFIMIATNVEPMFINTYLTFVFSSFVLSTISYDDYENGFSFLFSLPVSREGYVREKYLFCLCNAAVGWSLSFAFLLLTMTVRKQPFIFGELLMTGGMNLLVVLVFLGISIPIRIKLGAEKGKLVYFGIAGVIVILFVLMDTWMKNHPSAIAASQIEQFIDNNALWLEGLVAIIAIGIFAISYAVSLKVLEKKEF